MNRHRKVPEKTPFWRRRAFITFSIPLFIICFWLSLSLHYPQEIVSAPAHLPGNLSGQLAPDLIIQHIDDEATIWSVRGYCIYKSSDGYRFKRAFKVPSGSLVSWLGNFSFLRKISGYTELCEIFPLCSGTILAYAGGNIWRSTDEGLTFEKVHKVDAFRIGSGRGIMPRGLDEDREGIIYYGEYHQNPSREPVSIFRSRDDGKTWETAYRFQAGEIRHVHSLSVDPLTNTLWVTTGDRDEECVIAYSDNKGETFQIVGSGSQQWRAVDLLFTGAYVYWGSDAPAHQNYIYRLDRSTRVVERVCQVDGPIYYATSLCDGTLVMVSAVEGGEGELDDMVTIWHSRDGMRWKSIPLTMRKSQRRQAVLRLARGECGPRLLVTPLNTEDLSRALIQIDINDCYCP